jgi:hypothetical protein
MITERITNGVAGAAAASPLWLPWLQSVSNVAALVAPILGVVWLGTQIYVAWRGKKK